MGFYRKQGGYRMVGGRGKSVVFTCTVLGLAVLWPFAAMGAGDSRERNLQPQALDYVGVYDLRQAVPSLTGSGVKIAVVARSQTYLNGQPQNDYQPSLAHRSFASSRIQMRDDGSGKAGVCGHSTAICSILAGEDRRASTAYLGPFLYQGVAPQADIEVHELWHFLTGTVFSQSAVGADIVTLSSGSDFEDWWTRGLEAIAESQGLLVVASIGNGTEASHPPLYPGAGANVLGVGVVDSVDSRDPVTSMAYFSLAHPEHSSCGPTADKRCKPDIVAPGNCLVASSADPNGYESSGSWSSFATPVVAGIAGLLIQKAKQDPALAAATLPETGPCVMKAILMNSAVKLPYWHKGQVGLQDDHVVPLDYAQGAGRVDAVGAYGQLTAGRFQPGWVRPAGWDVNRVNKTNSRAQVYRIDVPNLADQMITATLAWNRHYRSSYPFDRLADLNTDLRLELWAVDPANPQRDLLLDYSDSPTDNVEHIWCKANPQYKAYQLVVLWNDVEDSLAEESYGLAWNVAAPVQDNGILWLDLNGDGVVNDLDRAILVQNWAAALQSPSRYAIGDLNGDGVIDAKDLQILASNSNRQAEWYAQ